MLQMAKPSFFFCFLIGFKLQHTSVALCQYPPFVAPTYWSAYNSLYLQFYAITVSLIISKHRRIHSNKPQIRKESLAALVDQVTKAPNFKHIDV